ncbi:YhgN family NAAT transporter [Buchnera aphidicola]|uniref:UPF0056 membrane protein n=1 Tax=Buchnera aphidicola (Anoecia oenotherae) TaxID=1241833 RepID=A0A4D6XYA5_9GAMM|nr:YhgN family NAAT transporter [Buchnera aphidicola]QCI19464.1 YhgN family NAAT transporter [Buchnera aphidicola (Anoecia oenotherae)]
MYNILSQIILLLLIMDPLGNLPVFVSILKKINPKRRNIVLIREMIIALFIMFLFLLFGKNLLNIFHVTTESVSISGGIILFLIALRMIFPSPEISLNSEKDNEEPFLVPLAVPLVSGPSLLATLMLLSHKYPQFLTSLSISLFIAWIITTGILSLSGFFLTVFGKKGIDTLEKLMGLILIMLSVQMFLDGIHAWLFN